MVRRRSDHLTSAPRGRILIDVRRGAILAWLLVSTGCVLGEVDLEGKACPCADGFVCDPGRNLCVVEGSKIGPGDAAVDDAGFVDGAVPRDGGPRDGGDIPGRDAGPRDGGGAPRDAGSRDAGFFPDCQFDLDCSPPDTICTNEMCVAACDRMGGATCNAPETCVDGRCIELGRTCAASKECGDGPPYATCVNGACTLGCASAAGACTGNRQCDDDGFCDVASRCLNAGACGHPDFDCIDNTCVRRCDRPGAFVCAGASICNAMGRCEGASPIGSACTVNETCDTGYCQSIAQPTVDVYCSRPCAATSDCPLDYTCARVSGAKHCVREMSFGGTTFLDVPTGGTCMNPGNICQSQVCMSDRCVERCSRNADCIAQSNICVTTEVSGANFIQTCGVGSGFPLDAACGNNTQCESGICNRYLDICQAPCCAHADCGAGQICTVYDLANALPQTICQARTGGAGTAVLGTNCATALECATELCAPIDPDNLGGPKACTTYCCDDRDCEALPGGGRCATFNGPIPNAQTKVCVPR